MSQFDKWLRTLKESGKGPVSLYCDRGVAFQKTIVVQRDLTGATVRGEVRASPDASGAALATFTVSALSVLDNVTTFTLALTEIAVNALPPDSTGEGVAELVYDLLVTGAGPSEQRLFAGLFVATGQVTL